MKCNTEVGIKTISLDGSVTYEKATIARWHHSYGKKSDLPDGYHLVKFADGGKRAVHESGMIVY